MHLLQQNYLLYFSMPFTISHTVLAPVLSRITGRHLPIAALAIGCMIPDLFRLFTAANDHSTHLWSGMLHPNLWIGLGFSALWYLIYRPVLYQVFSLSDPLRIHNFKNFLRFVFSISVAILLGNITHLLWDSVTHVDYRTWAFRDLLSHHIQIFHQTYPLHYLLQIGSSVLALPILIWMVWHYYQQHHKPTATARWIRAYFALLVVMSLIYAACSCWHYIQLISTALWQQHAYYFLGRSINIFMQGWLIVMTMGCLLLLFLEGKSSPDQQVRNKTP